ncbi:hypothetical protein BDM02DRAFT_3265521 [Thelephora ganbajun]|uniref:Uncharacterized protein n=1 Tax=Thelephora ganbajun TaxID=370292 RepID=A0ACB6ZUD4_THEGA|nr:hypothetical protein BDM02DRAFT_3265521 [Thelephora ganbajun]
MVSKRTAKTTATVPQKQIKKLTHYFSRQNTDATTSTRSSSPLSSLSSSPAPVSDRGSVKNGMSSVPAALSTIRKSPRLSALRDGDITISSGSSTGTSASSKSAGKGSTTSISSTSVGSSSLKTDSEPTNEPRVIRYRTRQADSNSASIRRPPAPSTKSRSNSLKISPAKPATKRKKQSSYNSDVEEFGGVVYVPRVTYSGPSVVKENLPPAQDDRPSLSPASKKLKVGPTCSVLYAPSSLSEEHELTLPPSAKRLPEVKETVQRWRTSSISFSLPPPPDVEMEDAPAQGDVDDEPTDDDFVPSSQSQPYLEFTSRILPTPSPELPIETLAAVMSSAPSSLTPLGTTLVHQSPVTSPPPPSPPRKSSVSYRPLSPPPSDFPEEPVVGANEDDDIIARLKFEVAAELALNPPDSNGLLLPDMSDDSSSEEEFRWSPGPRKASTSTTKTTEFSDSGRPMRQHKAPVRELVTLTKAPKKVANPLKELLRQHKKAEKGGYSASDLRRAEEHINAIKDMKIGDPLEELLHQDPLSTRTNIFGREESTSAILDSQAVMTILGEDEGTMVGQILQNDKHNKIVRRREVNSGIELFDQVEGSFKGSRTSAGGVELVAADTSDVVFMRFKNAVERTNMSAVRLMLDHGLLKRIKPSNRGSCLRWLLEQAFTLSDETMQEAAYHALSMFHYDHPLPLAAFASTLVALGAKPDVLAAAGFNVESSNVHRTRTERESLLGELLILVERLSRSTTFDDVSGMVTLLCLIALDRSLTPSLKRLVTAAIDTLAERGVSPQMERFVCMSLLKLASDSSISNKAALVVALGNGSPTVRRISRWLSTALIVGGTIIPENLNILVPASKIRGYLDSPQAGLMDTQGSQGSEEIDFENVTNKVTLLSVALTDITRQIEREMRAGASDLNAVSVQLANLHAKIVDTRAAHLDRSRTKAALQTLSFRVRYQVAAAQDSSLHRGKLQAYWAPTNSQ